MDLVTIIILLGIFQGIFFGVLLLSTKRGNRLANRLLGILMTLFSISISGFLLFRLDYHINFPYLIELPPSVIFLFGPFFYFYVKSLTNKNLSIQLKDLLHTLPFFILIIVRFIDYSVFNNFNTAKSFLPGMLVISIQITHLFIYLYFTNNLIKKFKQTIKNQQASIEEVNLGWIKFIITSFIIIFCMMVIFIVFYFSGLDLYKIYNIVIPVSVTIAIYIMGYKGWHQPEIIKSVEANDKTKKYERSSLTEERSEEYLDKLKKLMETQKPYLESSITLQKMAKQLAIQPHHLSQLINDKLNQNFFDFINYYRVEEAKDLLKDPKGELLTILAISEESGFNSKSAFNTAFKKHTGKTPSEFRKS